MAMRSTYFAVCGLVGAWVCADTVGCTGNASNQGAVNHVGSGSDGNTTTPGGTDAVNTVIPFEPQPARSYVAKVKDILVGQPASSDEIAAVTSDANGLRPLVQQWMQTPEYQAKMLQFLASAFQQTQVQTADFANQGGEVRGYGTNYLLQNLRESFARTALELTAEGRPFTETMTTRRFMLTVPLMMFYAYADSRPTNDRGQQTNLVTKGNPNFTITFEASHGPIALSASLNPSDPNYMHWYLPRLSTASTNPNCQWSDPWVFGPTTKAPTDRVTQMYRYLVNNEVTMTAADGETCGPSTSYDPNNAWVTFGDYNTWRMVTIRTPNPNEATTPLWDMNTLRNGAELVLQVPRVGFFSTPAFMAGWQTNSSNQFRVTMNQTLIVGLNHAIDGTDSIAPLSEAALDSAHAPSNSACFVCHQTLDPMRQFFRHDYSLFFAAQTDPNEMAMPGQFAFDGVSVSSSSIVDLGTQMAQHPRFALAWAQKLCTWANSAPCVETDPELLRLAKVFTDSNYNWNALVLETFTSPLVTFAQDTATADQQGVTLPVVTRERLCAALASRLGLHDPCALTAGTTEPTALRTVPTIVQVFSSLQYSRGSVTPVFANDPSLFFVAGMENLCSDVANNIIDTGSAPRYMSSDPNGAITDFVHNLMAVQPPDDTTPLSILQDNYAASLANGAKATDALKNTFVLACMAPSTIGMGL